MTIDRIKEDLGLARTTLSMQVLDTALGRPAAGLTVTITGPDGTSVTGKTDAEGRARVPGNVPAGVHTITFSTGPWFAAQERETWHPSVEVRLAVTTGQAHHLALSLSPFGYTAYRGA